MILGLIEDGIDELTSLLNKVEGNSGLRMKNVFGIGLPNYDLRLSL